VAVALSAGVRAMSVATRGKGVGQAVRRAAVIRGQYGVWTGRMADRLTQVLDLVLPYDFAATLPVPAVVLARYPHVVNRYAIVGIEFAVHGYAHVDHTRISADEQVRDLTRARKLFERLGVAAKGYRAPYLRWNDATLDALARCGYRYDGSQSVAWPIDPQLESDAYRRALAFTGALDAEAHAVVPWIDRGIVRIPYVLPDDEALVDRLRCDGETMARVWLEILEAVHERGELFTLAVHPERIDRCAAAVKTVLDRARRLRPGVWVATHADIATWWTERTAARVVVREESGGRFAVDVHGPAGCTLLVKGAGVTGAEPWCDGYVRAPSTSVVVVDSRRPFVGVHPSSPPALAQFLREQGFIVEVADDATRYARYVRRATFDRSEGRALLSGIEQGGSPLVRLGRWPAGARSALALTGDVDALTLRDYALRFVGR